MDPAHVEAVLGYALAVAAQADDWRHRELGPIHLLKYLYLADLAYANKHEGESFTGVDWRFHKFGPWAVEAFEQIEPAMAALEAERRQFTSRYRDDSVRWKLPADQLEVRESDLPGEVVLSVARAVREFGSDTSALLHHVYRTPPMLRAAPEDRLDLRPAPEPVEAAPPEPLPEVEISKTRVKKMREEVKRRLARKREGRRTIAPDPPPPYDEVFVEGVAWLDGPEPKPRTGRISFSEDVWTSGARGDTDLP
ncbi:MAG: SocA family protein [bacterium]|nr:SocA family protein [bacterium]